MSRISHRPIVIGLLASFIGHLMFVLFTMFTVVGRRPVDSESDHSPIVLEPVVPEVKRGKSHGTGHGVVSRPQLSLGDLMSVQVPGGEIPSKPGKPSVTGAEAHNQFEAESWQFRQGLGLKGAAQFQRFFDELWRQAERVIGYPDDFADERISGSVSARAIVGSDGVIVSDFLEVSSEREDLELYVASLLSVALMTPVPEKVRPKMDRIPVNFVIQFETHPEKTEAIHDRGGVVGNILTVKRHKFVEAKVLKAIHKFYKKFIPPILPVGGGFIVDFVRLYEMIQEWRRPDEGKLRQYRMEVFRRHLKAQ